VSEVYGRDGRAMVTTVQAAYSLGISPGAFRKWAHRRQIKARVYRWTPGPGRPQALWDLADISQVLTEVLLDEHRREGSSRRTTPGDDEKPDGDGPKPRRT
jgi:hypothetical protein